MRLPRASLRQLMLLVAATGAGMWVWTIRDRPGRCHSRSAWHAGSAKLAIEMANSPPTHEVCGTYRVSLSPEELHRLEDSYPTPAEHRDCWLKSAEYHVRAKRIFDRAAWRPWEAIPDIAPDPPEPE